MKKNPFKRILCIDLITAFIIRFITHNEARYIFPKQFVCILSV